MRKFFCVVLLVCFLAGCASNYASDAKEEKHIKGVWVSFLELDKMLEGDFKEEFEAVVNNSKRRKITDMFVCVRPFADAYYPSKIFPIRSGAQNQSFDVMAYMIDVCHKSDIKFHAWINPYRVQTANSEISNLPEGSPAKKWLSDTDAQNDTNVLVYDGIYLNPTSDQVRQLIIEGVREIINNYPVDGVHFDDYFYPTPSESFDGVSYAEYAQTVESPLAQSDWRRANINSLISGVYTAVKFKNKDIIFSVSPSASIEDNYNKYYADIAAWVESGCVDYIIPQLYFGFDYPQKQYRFENLINDWQELVKDSEVKLLIGLATYKINTNSELEKTEWANGVNVIKKQIEICENRESIGGHVYFSYSSMLEYIK